MFKTLLKSRGFRLQVQNWIQSKNALTLNCKTLESWRKPDNFHMQANVGPDEQ